MESIAERGAWGLMGILGVLLIIIGFQGSLGKVMACVLVPSIVVVNAGVT